MHGYNLTWDNFPVHMKQVFSDLCSFEYYSDVTIVCDDLKLLKAHRFILSGCSEVFKTILEGFHSSQPCIYLRGIKYEEMELVLKYIYNGEATIDLEFLETFLRVAKDLKIKGIDQDGNDSTLETNTPTDHSATEKVIVTDNTSNNVDNNDSLQLDYKQEDHEDKEDHDLFKKENSDRKHNKRKRKHKPQQSQCPECKKYFSQKYKMKVHYQNIHEGIRWPCDKCDYQARDRESLFKHMRIEHGNHIPYKCNKCDYEAKLRSSMYGHFKRYHSHAEFIQLIEDRRKQENKGL